MSFVEVKQRKMENKRKYFVNNSLELKKFTTEPTKYGLNFSVSV